MVERAGGCLCGAVRFTARGEPQLVGHCHCGDCRKSSGAGHVSFAFYREADLAVKGESGSHDVEADGGGKMTRLFCPRCGSRLFARSSRRPGAIGVVLGAFDEPAAFVPSVSLFVSRAQPWDTVAAGTARFDANIGPPPGRSENGAPTA